MTLPNWWQIATPHKDIREGRMSESIFAADLGDVVHGNAPIEYKDAGTFFQKTYLTSGLRNLLESVLSRLKNGKGDSVIQLQTPFGGGKTHALLALYHAIKNRDKVKYLEVISKLPDARDAKVAIFVGTQADPIKGKTPWGEIAHQLGVYEKVKEHDEKRRSPGKEVLNEVLGNKPVLILMDELVEYAVKAKDFAEQISTFSQEITELVKSKENCCLVCTLPSSAPYGEVGDRLLNELQRVFGRVESIFTPVEGVEIYEIIRKRLFEDLGSEETRKEVAQQYFTLYQKLGAEVPPEAKEIGYRERMEHAYPFHPELIDVLYERWGSYPSFQRTRGVLRLLAEVVADLYKRKISSPLIQSSLVNLENQTIRREFVKHIGNELESVIASDIAGKNAKAPKIDREMGSEYERYGIASGIATSVFLYSFSGAAKKETTLPRIRIALLREGIPHTIVGDAITKLEEELWYFHSERKQYAFRNTPNLNRVIMDREETVSAERIQEELKERIRITAGRALEVYLWPESSSDIPDNKNLKLAILSPDYNYKNDGDKKIISGFFEKAGKEFRIYKNTLFVLAMEDTHALAKLLKRFLALQEIQKDIGLLNTLTKESQEELKRELKEVEKGIPFTILTGYRYLALMEAKGVEWKDLGIPTIGTSDTISERVKQYLKDQEKILSSITPKYILEKTFGKEEKEKPLREIYELSLKTPGMPILESETVLTNAVKEGVKRGIVGVKESSQVYYLQDINPTIDSIVLRDEAAKRESEQGAKEKDESVGTLGSAQLNLNREQGTQKEGVTSNEKGLVHNLTLKAGVPWERLSEVIRGIVSPLKNKSQSLSISIEIKAQSGEGFDRTTLDSKVKETLRQIDAKIEIWKEE